MAATTSIPLTTVPKAVYFPSSDGAKVGTDEKRRRGAGRIVETRHRHGSSDVSDVVELRLQRVNIGLLLLRQRSDSRGHHPALDDETAHDAMKSGAVVGAG